jgi:hypothetical protein
MRLGPMLPPSRPPAPIEFHRPGPHLAGGTARDDSKTQLIQP